MPESPLHARHQADGARFTEEAGWQMPADFGDAAAEHLACRAGAVAIDLSHRGKVRISGPDAVKFLHGMLSNRVEGLNPGEGVYTTFLTRQGKFIADMNLYKREEDLAVDLAPGMDTVFAEAIDMYIIMDQVEVDIVTKAQCLLGVFGPEARKILNKAGWSVPPLGEHGHALVDGVMVARELWTGEDGYLLTAPSDRAEPLWEALKLAGARPAGLNAFETLTLEAGVPLFGKDMDANINPMQAGLETRAIDFEKGCYVGQEVIAKIKYLGQINRGLVGLLIDGETRPGPGDKVFLDKNEVGTLRRCAFGPTVEGIIAFGFLHRDAMASGTKVRVHSNGSDLSGRVVDLPFYRNESLAAETQKISS